MNSMNYIDCIHLISVSLDKSSSLLVTVFPGEVIETNSVSQLISII